MGRSLICIIVTYAYIFFCKNSTILHKIASTLFTMLPYRFFISQSFGDILMPDYYPCLITRLVSSYALFKWSLLPSLHPSCHSNQTLFDQLRIYLGALAVGLGYSPFGYGPYHPHPHYYKRYYSIRSLSEISRWLKPPHPISNSTSIILNITLYLNTFRGVRAISEFDWPFTPTHRSSEDFSTSTSSVLHHV